MCVNSSVCVHGYSGALGIIGAGGGILERERGVRACVWEVRLCGQCVSPLGFGGVGMAVPDRVAEFQIATLKNMG